MGWAAITRLLARGKSLSGREPNSCFLNLAQRDGTTRFADVSAATGFNFIDDSRALGFVDWDFDGDLDIWMVNRTAPTVRFLRNDQNTENSSVSLFLKGSVGNRNAVGARITIVSRDPNGDEIKQSRTLSAGGTYLSQSSSWVHFGLGNYRNIISTRIIWPQGTQQELSQIEAGGKYRVNEGRDPVAWTAPTKDRFPLTPGALEAPSLTNAGRLIIANRPLFPFALPKKEKAKPNLISLWSASCPVCLDELKTWSQSPKVFADAGLNIQLMNVDSDEQLALEKLNELGVSFPQWNLKPREVGSIDAFQQAISAIHLPLMTPTSFLLDEQGRVAVVYRGPVTPLQIVEDLALLNLSEMDRLAASIPYPGLWWKQPRGVDPSKIALLMHDEGLTGEAITYLNAEISASKNGTAPLRSRPVFELNFSLARLHFKIGEEEKAISAYRQTLATQPNHLLSLKELSRILYDQGQHREAFPVLTQLIKLEPTESANVSLLTFSAIQIGEAEAALSATKTALKSKPQDPVLLFCEGLIHQAMGNWQEALNAYQKAVRKDSQQLVARNNIAWILCTAPSEEIRNAPLAKKVIAPLLQAPGKDRALFLRTAAAAHANLGEFKKAETLCVEALKISEKTLSSQLKNDLSTYRMKKPLRF